MAQKSFQKYELASAGQCCDIGWNLTVPVDCALDREIILDKHLERICFLDFYQRAGLLTIDEIDITSKTV